MALGYDVGKISAGCLVLRITSVHEFCHKQSSATAEIARVVPVNNVMPKKRLRGQIFVADSMGLVSVNLTQWLSTVLCVITRSDSDSAVQGHPRSLILVPSNTLVVVD